MWGHLVRVLRIFLLENREKFSIDFLTLQKIKEHQQESRNENVAKEISVIEDDFIKLKQAVSKRLISLK